MPASYDKVVKTTVWSPGPGCHGGCGAELYVKDGKVVKVEGDATHPWSQGRACPRLLAMTQYMYHPDRLRYPMKRAGERGEGKWERISWDEALDVVETRFKAIRDQYGAESVIFCQGTGRDIGGAISFLAYNFGSPNWVQLGLAGQSCYTPRLASMWLTQGDYSVLDAGQFFIDRYDNPEWVPPKVIVMWAQNPTPTCPDGFFGHWIVDCMRRGSKLIVIDHRTTWYACRAKHHLQIRPGTDGALALAWLNVIIGEGLYDREFVERWTVGFDRLAERVKEYTPERVSQITWASVEQIVESARMYATNKPAAIHWGVPIDQAPQGVVQGMAIAHLWQVTGNLDIPGGNVFARPCNGVSSYPYSTAELHEAYGAELVKKLTEKRIGAGNYPLVRDFRGWAQPDMTIEQCFTGDPYPIKGAWIQSTNILGGQAANTQKHYQGLKRLEFIAVADLFMNPTIQALADIVLPVATFAEKQSFRSWWAPLCAIVPAVEVDECRSDYEINVELANRFNPNCKYQSVEELINDRLKPSGYTYHELIERGGWEMPREGDSSRPYHRHEKGLLRQDGKPGFRTPSGKIELYSSILEGWGYDPLVYYAEASESEVSTPDLFVKYPLVMATGRRSPVYFHAEHRMISWLRQIDPDPIVEINTRTARSLGIEDGELVVIENDRGKIMRKAKVTPTIHPKVVSVPHGWWMPEEDGKEPNLYGIWKHNVNQLIPVDTYGELGFGGGAYKTTLCRVRKMEKGEF